MVWLPSCESGNRNTTRKQQVARRLVTHTPADNGRTPKSRRRVLRLSVAVVFLLGIILGGGFMLFADNVTQRSGPAQQNADAIVALTGTPQRIQEAAQLLAKGRGQRMLVSGVNPQATSEEVRRMTALSANRFDCCVDLGYEAKDTIGNADEARAWVDAHKFRSIIVVTSDYHMPRSLAEFGRAMPDVTLIPHPVASRLQRGHAWWKNPVSVRILAAEYAKFLPSAVRFAMVKLARAVETRIATAAPASSS